MSTRVSKSAQRSQSAKIHQYVNRQLNKTRRQVKSTELITHFLVATIFAIGFLQLVALVDAWVWSLNSVARWLSFIFLMLSTAAYLILTIGPLLLRKIHPDYAAKMIEAEQPSFKNSLLNYVSLRRQPEATHVAVMDAVTKQAAIDLQAVPEDATVDRSSIVRIGFYLLGLIAFVALYWMLSPKDPLHSFSRILLPAAKKSAPSIVQVTDVSPGDHEIFFGDPVEVSATIKGQFDPQDVRLIYSTADGQIVDQSLPMEPQSPSSNRYEATLTTGQGGVQQGLVYRVEARDGASPDYEVVVRPNPSITLKSVEITPPAYTLLSPDMVTGQGSIEAVEGSLIKVNAEANLPIKLAYVELLVKRSQDESVFVVVESVSMSAEGTEAHGEFHAIYNYRAQKQRATHFRLKFLSAEDDANQNPNVHALRVIPDLAPEVEVLNPIQNSIRLPVNETLLIDVRATDLDYGISSIELEMQNNGTNLFRKQKLPLQSEEGKKRVRGQFQFTPEKYFLRPGETVLYTATASDNRTSYLSNSLDPNQTMTRQYKIEILDAVENPKRPANPDQAEKGKDPEQQDPSEQGDDSQSEGGESGEGESRESESGEGDSGESEASESGGEAGEQGGEQSGDQGESGESGKDGGQAQGAEQTGDGSSQSDQGEAGESSSGGESEGSESQSDTSDQGESDGAAGTESGEGGESPSGESESGKKESGQSESGQSEGGESSGSGQQGGPSNEGQQNSGVQDGARKPLGEDAADGDVMSRMEEIIKEEKAKQGDVGDNQAGANGQDQQPAEQQTGRGTDPDQKNPRQSEGTGSTQADDFQPPQDAKGGKNNAQRGDGDSSSSQGEKDGNAKGSSGSQTGDQSQEGASSEDSKTGQSDEGGGNDPGNGSTDSTNQNDQGAGQSEEGEGGKAGKAQSEGAKASEEAGEGSGQQQQGGKEQGESGSEGDSGDKSSSESGSPSESGSSGQPGDPSEGSPSESEGEGGAGSEGASGQPSESGGESGGQSGGESGGDGDESGAEGSAAGESASSQGESGNSEGSQPPSSSSQSQSSQSGGSEGDGPGSNTIAEKENIEHSKKATDMVLKRLEEERFDPDSELLDELNWSKEDLNQFLNRWEKMKAAAEAGDPIAKQRYEKALKSLGLSSDAQQQKVRGVSDKQRGFNTDSAVNRPPQEIAPGYRAFKRARNRSKD